MDDGRFFLAYLKPFYPTWDDARAANCSASSICRCNRKAETSIARHADEGRAGFFPGIPAAR